MDTVKYDVKIFLHADADVKQEAFIPIFHRWIQGQQLDELLIDVVDYRHVYYGPGVVLVAHDAHYAMDAADGRLGLLYSRRRETHPSRQGLQGAEERLRSVLHCALTVCQRLEAEPTLQGQLRFRGDTWLLRVNDRLLAGHADAVLDSLDLKTLLAQLYPDGEVKVERITTSDARPTFMLAATVAPDVQTLYTRLNYIRAGMGVGA
jgi:hypothetical protein